MWPDLYFLDGSDNALNDKSEFLLTANGPVASLSSPRSLMNSQYAAGDTRPSMWPTVRETAVLFTAPMAWRLDRKKPAPKHSDGFLNSSGKGVGHDHRLCESFDNGAES